MTLVIEGAADAGLGIGEIVVKVDGDVLVGGGIGGEGSGVVEVGAAGGVVRDYEVVDFEAVGVVSESAFTLHTSADAVEVLAEGRADVVASAGGVGAVEVVACEDYAAFGAVVRGGVFADDEVVIVGAKEEVHADGVAEIGVEIFEVELDVALAGAVALSVGAVGGDGGGAVEDRDLGDDAELGGAGAVLDGGG